MLFKDFSIFSNEYHSQIQIKNGTSNNNPNTVWNNDFWAKDLNVIFKIKIKFYLQNQYTLNEKFQAKTGKIW